MKTPLHILHVEDNTTDASLIQALLEADGIGVRIERVETRDQFQEALDRSGFDLILSDFTLPAFDGLSALEMARNLCPEVPFIFVSGTLGEEAAVESLKHGAVDYVLKDRLSRLAASVRRAVEEAAQNRERRRIEAELRQRDELFRLITDHVDDLIWVVDLEGRQIYQSASCAALLGQPQGMLGGDCFAEIHPQDRDRVKGLFRQTVRSGVSHRTEYRLLLRHGAVRHLESSGSVIRDSQGRVTNVVWVSRDVTERRKAEEQLREQATLLDQAHDAICVTDMDQRILLWNNGAERLYGWAPEEALDEDINELLFPGSLKAPLAALKSLIGRDEWHGELEQITKHKRRIVADSRWTLLRDPEGKPKRILVINTDVTEQRLAERKIREQAALLDRAQDAIFVRDLDQRITYWNQGAERLYGWKAEEVLGQRASDLLYPSGTVQRQDVWRMLLEQGEWMGELSQVSKDGRELVVMSRRTLLYDPRNEPVAALNINTDITDKKQMELQFLRSQRLESIGTLAGGIAHDLNNVLTPVMMAADLLQNESLDEFAQDMLATIKASVQRGADMVKQILSFARGAAGEPDVMQLRHLARDVAKLASDTFPRSIQIKTDLPGDLHPVLGDATQLHQVLLNLCVNARDAMPQGGTLTIKAANVRLENHRSRMQEEPARGPYLLLTVQDTGLGIPPELLHRIFEPFFTTKEPGKGTGLGLSTVANIVRNHGGFAEVESAPGLRTEFKVYLPAAVAGDREPQIAPPAELPAGRGELLLLVDDELALLEMTKETLETFQYRVMPAKDGAEAASLYMRHRDAIALVVTDLMMPVMDGPALIRALREANPKVKILCISGLASEGKLSEVDRSQVSGFLLKPYSAAQLLLTVRQVLSP